MNTAVALPPRAPGHQNPAALAWRFERALRKLENAASPPAQRGEPAACWGRLLTQFPPLEPLLICKQGHNSEVLEEIARVDASLLGRVEPLRFQGAELIGRFLELWKQTRGLHRHPGGVQADRLDALCEKVLAWIASCRAHDQEITAWFQEAHLRDRGVAG